MSTLSMAFTDPFLGKIAGGLCAAPAVWRGVVREAIRWDLLGGGRGRMLMRPSIGMTLSVLGVRGGSGPPELTSPMPGGPERVRQCGGYATRIRPGGYYLTLPIPNSHASLFSLRRQDKAGTRNGKRQEG